MTHRLHTSTISHLPIHSASLRHKPIKFYSLFKLNGNSSQWVRASPNAYSELIAYRVFGSRLAENPLVYRIRPMAVELPEAK